MPVSADIYNQFAPRVQSPQDVTNGLMQQAALGQGMQSQALGMQERQAALADRPRVQARADEVHASKMAGDKVETEAGRLKNLASKAELASRGWAGLDPNNREQFVSLLAEHVQNDFLDREKAVKLADDWEKMTPDDRLRMYYQQGLKGVDGKTRAQLAWQAEEEKGRNTRAAAEQKGQTERNDADNKRALQQTGMQNTTSLKVAGIHEAGSDRRHASTAEATLTKPFEVTGPDGVTKILVQQDKKGNIKPVQGYGPKSGPDKPLTEVQANATSFVSRMRDASGTADVLEKNVGRLDTEAAKSIWTNWIASPKAQQYHQARRNWVTANLRKESGAAIPNDELENEYKKWFPVIGDSEAVISQKQQSRRVAEEAMTVQAGPGSRQVPGILERGGSPAVKAPDGWKIEKVS
jgi:hypothetical protein